MNRINPDIALGSVYQGEQEFKFLVDLNILAKFQLYLTGQALKGVEIFGIGPQEIKGFGFLIEFSEIINTAVRNEYRVFVKKDGPYFGKGNWHMEFRKNI